MARSLDRAGAPQRHGGSHRAVTHRSGRSRTSRRWPSLVLLVVLVAGAALVVVRVAHESGASARSPVLALPGQAGTPSLGIVYGTVTQTDDCLSVPSGLLVWPRGTTWDAGRRRIDVVADKSQIDVGDRLVMHGTVMKSIPTRATDILPADLLAALRRCSESTGISSVALVD